MRYVVKDTETNRFLSSSGEWTPFITQAQRFPNGLSVNLHLEKVHLPNQETVRVVEVASV